MQSLKNMSIKTKLMVLTMLAVMTAMTLACIGFVANDIRLIRADMTQQLTALAEVVGANTTAALTFDDADTATQLLGSLKMQRVVDSATLFNAEGELFATFIADDAALDAAPPLPDFAGYKFDSRHLHVVQPLVENGEQIGSIYIMGDLDVINQQLINYAVVVLVVMLISCGAAYLLASRLQILISGPILDLTTTAQQISAKNDYSIRATKTGTDELGTLCDKFNHMLDQVEASKAALEQAHNDLERRVEDRTRQLSETNSELNKEITERLKAEEKLETVHREFVDAARRAGMAEIATGVLHNVGNVLNSVNVSATMLTNQLKTSKVTQLSQVVNLMEQNSSDLGTFITNNEKGKQVPRFLKVLSEHLAADEKALLEEAEALIANVDHIKTIISTQQSYATSGGMIEPVEVNALLDDAVKLHATSFGKHRIELVRDYAALPTLLIDKQRLMQIVINLVKNAKEALREQQESDRKLIVRTKNERDRLIIEVSDTGVGIKPEQLTKVFSHGFTTKATGHGFGLHSCANAATEMEGKLTACSAGHMQGATFRLDLPFRPASVGVK
jgi:two-component system, NtrC family, sensor kinase